MIALMLGLPGSGKGTQGSALAGRSGLEFVSMGALLRSEISRGSEFGKRLEPYVSGGRTLPDELARIAMEQIFNTYSSIGFVGDGIVRTIWQARTLDAIASRCSSAVDTAVMLELPTPVAAARLADRVTCPSCGSTYHPLARPPVVAGKCDRDGVGLVRRPDDNLRLADLRIRRQHSLLASVLDYYRGSGRLREVDAQDHVNEVASRVWAAVFGPKVEASARHPRSL